MTEAAKCPKCGGEMIEAHRLVAHTQVLSSVSLAKKGDLVGDRIIPFYCRDCGYIEFYKESAHYAPKSYLKKCVKCGRQIPIAAEECQHCGASQLPEKKGVES